jgi:hypothetical protein
MPIRKATREELLAALADTKQELATSERRRDILIDQSKDASGVIATLSDEVISLREDLAKAGRARNAAEAQRDKLVEALEKMSKQPCPAEPECQSSAGRCSGKALCGRGMAIKALADIKPKVSKHKKNPVQGLSLKLYRVGGGDKKEQCKTCKERQFQITDLKDRLCMDCYNDLDKIHFENRIADLQKPCPDCGGKL